MPREVELREDRTQFRRSKPEQSRFQLFECAAVFSKRAKRTLC